MGSPKLRTFTLRFFTDDVDQLAAVALDYAALNDIRRACVRQYIESVLASVASIDNAIEADRVGKN